MKKQLNNLFKYLLFALPVVVFFSYHPVIRLGENDSMYFELSLPLIWLFSFGTLSILRAKEIIAHFGTKKLLILAILPFYITLSILWSHNITRGILTTGIVWLLLLSILNIISLKLPEKTISKLINIHLITAVFVAAWCLIQSSLDVFGVSRNTTLLCEGCIHTVFGFPHPNGFAIEPQFMGNLLIIPAIISLIKSYNNILSKKDKGIIIKSLLLTLFIIMALFICFSRGAIYSFILAVIFIFGYQVFHRRLKTAFIIPIVVSIAFLFGLTIQGLFAELSPTSEGFIDGISTSLNQLSLGKIDLKKTDSQETTQDTTSNNEAAFNGYIEESTTTRLDLNKAAITISTSNPRNLLFGVGIGGAGSALSENLNFSKKEIIQNEALAILLELGLIGVIITALEFFFIFKLQRKIAFYLWAIIIAFAASLMFFSGLPNALHIYLMIPLVFIAERSHPYGKIE